MTTSTMQNLDATQVGRRPSGYRLPDTTRIGRVRLAVSDLERSVAFYSEIIGLAVLEPATAEVRLARLGTHGDGRVLLELVELPGVQPIGRRTRLGLYHTAFLLPSRSALSSFVQHLIERHVPFGSGDHVVSEAMYLTDPDGLTVEVYADRPRSEWRVKDGEIQGGNAPVNFDDLLTNTKQRWQGAFAGTVVGHMHFYVGDLEKAAAFYHTGLGFDNAMWPMPSALFLSAGGYHHHVGVNIWAAGSPIASAKDARLLFWELALPDPGEIDRASASLLAAGFIERASATGARSFADAWGITVALVVAAS